jgi:hypothetical protein
MESDATRSLVVLAGGVGAGVGGAVPGLLRADGPIALALAAAAGAMTAGLLLFALSVVTG